MDRKIDPITEANAYQNDFYASLGDRNDRASVTGGGGYSFLDYEAAGVVLDDDER